MAAFAPLASACAQNQPAQQPPAAVPFSLQDKFIHHVFFWLKEPDNQEAHQKIREGMQLLTTIEEIKHYQMGVAAATDRPVIENTYSYSFTMVFNNKADQDIYQDHPTHKKFVDEYSQLWEKVLVFDTVSL